MPSANPGGNGSSGGGGSEIRERLARVEVRVESLKDTMATKTDVANLKVWILAGVLSTMAIAVATTVAVMIKGFLA